MLLSIVRANLRAGTYVIEKGLGSVTFGGAAPEPHWNTIPKILHLEVRKYGNGRPETGYASDYDSDSDSDNETFHGEKGTSEFWRRKMRTFHGVIDINKDGVVSYDDFLILAERFVDLGHLTPKQQEDFKKLLRNVWEEQWGVPDRYNLVSTEKYLENMHHVLNDKSLKRKAHRFLPYLFKAVDKDKDGVISVEEYKLFFHCLGMNSEDAICSFRSIDINEDGYLSLKEFVKLGREFFLTEDKTKPSKYFWGPLVKP